MGRAGVDEGERVEIASLEALRAWLSANGERQESAWLVTWKKSSGGPYVPRDDVVDELLCHGWIDSLPRKLDGERTMLLISPRRPGSRWSKVNKDKVARLERDGRMFPAGLAAVARAMADGTWSALDEVDALTIPDDLAAALDAHPPARARFERFPPSSRRGILEWIASAKRPDTRARRVRETAAKAAVNRKANFPKGRDAGPPAED